ncbi:protein of unknown function DUF928 [Gloeothece citriformis PCC 7424]|uniref:DUF928 domain-containing protein n=1 Tax=Gloeothece citriformis (strain PCC 7424) TaxID=65393 RepID=B7K889_GLOC7|nr:DUF928 domain-containing protein [Gloeothece citriformis]ACK69849.1 protein of unknown function DUF928 [Gloeothece citriformis PCC 7424]
MIRPSYLTSLGLIVVVISPTLMGFSSLSNSTLKPLHPAQISLNFPPTGNRGAPKSTAGGGTRSDDYECMALKEGDIPLVALMPNRENIGKTATSTPTLYWYVPETKATDGELVVLDDQGNEVYYTNFALSQQSGIVKLTIPPGANLQPGKTYSWSFMVICDSNYRNRDKFVEGKIEYIAVNDELKNQLKKGSDLEKAQLYAQQSIWYETLDLIAKNRPQNTAEWQQLLQSVGLGSLTEKPLIECCQPKQ